MPAAGLGDSDSFHKTAFWIAFLSLNCILETNLRVFIFLKAATYSSTPCKCTESLQSPHWGVHFDSVTVTLMFQQIEGNCTSETLLSCTVQYADKNFPLGKLCSIHPPWRGLGGIENPVSNHLQLQCSKNLNPLSSQKISQLPLLLMLVWPANIHLLFFCSFENYNLF